MTLTIFDKPISRITFQVTEKCNCQCSYCYQIQKSQTEMTKDIADLAINFLFDHQDEYTDTLRFTFIGGEPFLNIEIIDYICSIFLDRCMQEKHIWGLNWTIQMTTNGISYFNPAVQRFIEKYKFWLKLQFSIDGTQEAHNQCRYNNCGKGSFDAAWAALNHYRATYDKDVHVLMTVDPANVKYLSESVIFLYDNAFTNIHINLNYEYNWNKTEAKLYYKNLIDIADYCIKHNMQCEIFNDQFYKPMSENDNHDWCENSTQQFAIDCQGKIYPCIKLTKSALGNAQTPIIIGDVKNGFFTDADTNLIMHEICTLNRRNQTTDECYYCPIAQGCFWCHAYDYQCTGNFHERNTNICLMHQAQALANHYYYIKQHKHKHLFLPKAECLQFIDENEYWRLIDDSYNSK